MHATLFGAFSIRRSELLEKQRGNPNPTYCVKQSVIGLTAVMADGQEGRRRSRKGNGGLVDCSQALIVGCSDMDDKMPGKRWLVSLCARRAWIALGVLSCLFMTVGAEAASLESCVAGLRSNALRSGIPRATVDAMLSNVTYDEKVVRFSRTQPEHRTAIWDYMAFLVDVERIGDGKAMLAKYDRTLRAVERRYGVDWNIVLAVWGIESNYGKEQGDFYTPHALANLVCAGGRRARYFRSELMNTLSIAARGDVPARNFRGSWAGAFGQTQFMPSTYLRLAVDFDGDGHRDLVDSVPDALASTANFLRNSGWQEGHAWGYEVLAPKGYSGPEGRSRKTSLSTWGQRGFRLVNGKTPSGRELAGLIRPAGPNGPAFLVTRNFDAIYSYNASEAYGLAIVLLSELVSGGDPFHTPWPTDDLGLSRAQRLNLQKLLKQHGFYKDEVDGKIGPASRAAIERAERAYGLPETGNPSWKVYEKLGGK